MTTPPATTIYIINTNASWFGGTSPHDKWFSNERAFTGGDYDKYGRRVLGRLKPDDILLMYANGRGIVGIGTVLEAWDGKIQSKEQLVYSYPPDDEYSIRVKWNHDLRRKPIFHHEIQDGCGIILGRTLISVKQKREPLLALLRKHNISL
jgi:hypothetical protein